MHPVYTESLNLICFAGMRNAMNRSYLRPFYTSLLTILLLAAFASAVSAQPVSYSIQGTLSLGSGLDILSLNGKSATATATLDQSLLTPSSSTTTSISSSNTYNVIGEQLTLNTTALTCSSSTVIITDNVGAPGSIQINNCEVTAQGLTAYVTASFMIPAGYVSTAVPATIPSVSLLSGTVSYSLSLGGAYIATYNLTGATIAATGALPPAITPNPPSWTPTATIGSTTPFSQPVTLSASSAVTFTAGATTTSGGNWLSVTPAAANTTSSLSITVDPTGLTQPSYSGTVTLTIQTGDTVQIPVTLTMSAPAVTLSASALSAFSYTIGSTPPTSQTLTIGSTPASANVSAAVTSGNAWLSVTPSSGATPAPFTVSVNTAGLTTPGPLSGNIQITSAGATNSPLNVPVTLNVTAATLTAGPSLLTFNYQTGQTPPASQPITVGGTPGIAFTATPATTSGGSWLTATANGPTPGSVTVSVNPGSLTANTYNGTVTIAATGAVSQVINVTFVVTAPSLTATPTSLNFAYQIGQTPPSSQPITVGGTPGIAFTATPATTSGGSWLSATANGPTPGSVTVSVNPGSLTANTYNGTITIASTGAVSQVINVTFVVTAPSLTATPTSLNFAFQIGQTPPLSQPITVGGTSGIAFTATPATTSGGSWLIATANSPTPGSVTVSVNPGSLTANTYNGTVTIASTGAVSQVVNVTFVVSNSPTISASPSSLSFSYQIGGTAPGSQSITVGGTSGLAFTATAATASGGSWLSAIANGPTPGSVSVSVNPGSLTAKTYKGTVTIAATGATSQVVNVTFVVSSSPTISASPSSLTFSYQIGGTALGSQSITVGGTSGIAFTATPATTSGGSWLTATANGPTPGSVSVSVNPGSLTANTYKGTVTIAASGVTSQVVNVTLTVSAAALTVKPSSLSFAYQIGGAAPVSRTLTIGGTAGLSFTATASTTSGGSWLSATANGPLPGSVTVSVNPGSLTANTYTGTVTISAAGATAQVVNVSFVVSSTAPITLSATTLNFTAAINEPAPAGQVVNVTSSPQAPVSIALSGGSWLSATISSASTPSVITVTANQANLTAGTYMATVIVTSTGASNSPQSIAVTFVVSPSLTITATPASLSFAYVINGATPAVQQVNVTAPQRVTISTSAANSSWLAVTNSSSATPDTLTVSVNPASLSAGNYSATISISGDGASNSPIIVPVALVVSSQPTLAASPSTLTFTAPSGGANPASQSINITGGSKLAFTAVASASWLNVSVAPGTTPSTLVATVNSQGMNQGSYQGSITLASSSAGNSPLNIPVTLLVTQPLIITGPQVKGIVNGASYDSSGFAPGSLVSIFGSGLGPQKGVAFSLNSHGSLDNTLGGVTVTVAGISAIPLYVEDGQVNVILPFNLGATGQASVEVQYNNQTSIGFNIPLTSANVQIFTANASGSGPGSILNQDYSVNTASHPAPKGSIVQVYGTGAGALHPAVTAGGIAGTTLSRVSLPYSATVNGETAIVKYAGSAPNLVYGVDQFNVQIPADAPSGRPVKIVLTVGDSMSQSDVTVFVK